MARLEDLTKGASVKGILPKDAVTILDVDWHGGNTLEVTYRRPDGRSDSQLLYRDQEPMLEVAQPGTPWAFDSDANLFRLASEAYRIRMAYLFDPWLAIHLSFVDPLPHQITAVYQEMLPRQPLRFLLADDPGAGKTIMTGLYIKELMLRGDLERCLIVAPGNLCEQWQDELDQRFGLHFEILTNDRIQASRSGDPFDEMPLLIARLDKLSRDESLHPLLEAANWDLAVVDEAHKMSARVWQGEISYTKRYRLGEILGRTARHLLLLSATPHNGKEEDFQLFLGLIDPDRFAGLYKSGEHSSDAADLFRRMVKEQLLKFDGTRLFPERRAYAVSYRLSDEEAALYAAVTDYVREGFNRADALGKDGRRTTVGFALTVLQRRLASSPEAIYKSLKRRQERLESRLNDERLLKRGAEKLLTPSAQTPHFDEDEIEDLEDAPEDEFTNAADRLVDLATAAQTVAELEAEIADLKRLVALAEDVRRSGRDTKWAELSNLLQDNASMFDPGGARRKLVIFSEHRDTLEYLADRLRTLLGKPEAVVTISGGMPRQLRRRTQESFVQDPRVQILVATDAAGEGINLQRAHLMVNYDLPWNPARLEQRFGRIHRIGQTEVCHLWNLVAEETREGDVYRRLLEKIEEQRKALGDGIFDILGQLLQQQSLRELLIEAIRYGDRPDVRQRLFEAVDNLADQDRCRQLLEQDALAQDQLDSSQIRDIKHDFERAQARRLQPHFIAAFFKEAFRLLGGSMFERENQRYQITHVPGVLRSCFAPLARGVVLAQYERVTFHKELVAVQGKPLAEFLAPGHPLLDALIDVVLENHRGLLRKGALLVDPNQAAGEVRVLFYLEHSLQDGVELGDGERRHISRQMLFVELNQQGEIRASGAAPYLDYRPLEPQEREAAAELLQQDWLRGDLEGTARSYAAQNLVPQHLAEVRQRTLGWVQKTRAAVRERLTREINFWDLRAAELKEREQAGKPAAKMNSALARRRADELQARLQKRMTELEKEEQLFALPPALIGAAIVIPASLLTAAPSEPEAALFGKNRDLIERAAVEAVMAAERRLGFVPTDISAQRKSWDIESAVPGEGRLRFIEVKGRIEGATTVTVSRNEILTAINKPEDFILAIVSVAVAEGEGALEARGQEPRYVRRPFDIEPGFAVTSVNFNLRELLEKSTPPE